MPQERERWLLWLGKYLSLALTLPASVAAGYIVGAIAEHWLRTPIVKAIGIILGMAAGLTQILKELSRESNKTGPDE